MASSKAVAAASAAAVAPPLAPITDIKVLVSKTNPVDTFIKQNSDGEFKLIKKDLNYGTGGRFIYLAIKRGYTQPINALKVLISSGKVDDTDRMLPKGFKKLPQNLNLGNEEGRFVYLAYKRGGVPLVEVEVLTSTGNDKDDTSPSLGFVRLPGNLNEGTMYGRFVTIAMKRDSSGVYSCGRGAFAALGHRQSKGNEMLPRILKTLYGQSILRVFAGAMHSAAIDDGGRLLTWGTGRNGQLGNRTVRNMDIPTPVKTLQKYRVTDVALGAAHSAALTDNGLMFTWGRGLDGALGVERLVDVAIPGIVTQFADLSFKDCKVVKIAAGSYHTGAVVEIKLTGDQVLFCWGMNKCGQLGDGNDVGRGSPNPVPEFNAHAVRSLDMGHEHTVVATDKGVYTWGSGKRGALGHGDVKGLEIPRKVSLLEGINIMQVAAGGQQTAALSAEGRLYMWGNGDHGRLGLASNLTRNEPNLVNHFDSKVRHVSVGAHHCAAIDEDGKLFTWGCGSFGRLGHGTPYNQHLPKELGFKEMAEDSIVTRKTRTKQLALDCAAGGDHTLVVCVKIVEQRKYRFSKSKDLKDK